MSQQTEFDIVRIKPHVDLVIFDNVISCYSWTKDITATYTLGEAVKQTTWDWIGIFRCDWKYLGEYVAYRWSPDGSLDCTAPRRRGIVFPQDCHGILPDDRQFYQFLYVSHGNHVVGVSSPFHVDMEDEMPDFNIASLFRELTPNIEKTNRKRKSAKENGTQMNQLCDTYDIINELAGPSLPKRRAPSGKQKFTNVYKDPDTLLDFPAGRSNSLRTTDVHPIVKEYSTALLPYNQWNWLRVYDINMNKRSTAYPTMLSLNVGPQSFMQLVNKNTDACFSCQVAKTLVAYLADKEDVQEMKVASLTKQMKDLINKGIPKEESRQSTVDLLDWCLQQVQLDNQSLRERVTKLERSLAMERTKRESTEENDNDGSWIVQAPKKLARLKKLVENQSHTIASMKQSLENKDAQIVHLRDETDKLKKMVQDAQSMGESFRGLSEQLTLRIQTVLSERAKSHTNEWRQFIRKENTAQTAKATDENTTQTAKATDENTTQTAKATDENTTQTAEAADTGNVATDTVVTGNTDTEHIASSSCRAKTGSGSCKQRNIKHKQIAKIMKSEKQPKTKLHKERSQAELCPTCGLKFSAKTDRRVIEEHMVFHDREQK